MTTQTTLPGAPVATTATPRFYRLTDLAEILNISGAQAYSLVRTGSLPAIKVGGRGQWRVEAEAVQEFIQRSYAETRGFVEAHPFDANLRRDDDGDGIGDPDDTDL